MIKAVGLIIILFSVLMFWLSCYTSSMVNDDTQPDPLRLQHELSHAVDSIDSLYRLCGAPEGCSCVRGKIYCSDMIPELP